MITSTPNGAIRDKILALALLTMLLAAFLLLAAGNARASTTFTVTNTNDDGADSLRQAILDANATSGADVINFNIPGTGVHTIAPATNLPQITDPVTIDGYSQQGAQPNTKAVGNDAVLKIELSGANAPSGAGLYVSLTNSTVIKGLAINRWTNGITIAGSSATGNNVTGNYIGTDASGTQDLGNDFDGVYIGNASGNTIGGATAAERNVISGNDYYGVEMDGLTANNNAVVGNYVGTDASGTQDLGNRFSGVYIQKGSDNTVGGTTAVERNVLSGNDYSGVLIYGTSTKGNKVTGNYIGTDATGTKDLGNSADGVYIGNAPDNTIGGTTAGERNVISANDYSGVYIVEANATGNKVTGNYVGTDATGTKDLGNTERGIFIYYGSNNTVGGTSAGERNVVSANESAGIAIEGATATGNKVKGNYVGTDATGTQSLGNSQDGVVIANASDNTVGGAVAGARNVISANGSHGVDVLGDATSTTSNRIISNSISGNGGLGIDLGFDGRTPNDPGDGDSGPNNLQNFPVLTSARTSVDTTTVKGTLNSTPNGTFLIQLFSNPTGTHEGKTLIGETSVTTDASGNASFSVGTSHQAAVGANVTATATDAAGNTSEFSAPVAVPNTGPTITNPRPAPGSTTRDRTPAIGAKVTDAETDLARSNIKLYVDGNRRDFAYDRSTDLLSFTPGANLSFSKHTVKIVATDASALAGTRSWSFGVVR